MPTADEPQPLVALCASVSLLRAVVEPLVDAQLQLPAYPTEWTIADVLSHIGSGAVILQRRLDDAPSPPPDEIVRRPPDRRLVPSRDVLMGALLGREFCRSLATARLVPSCASRPIEQNA